MNQKQYINQLNKLLKGIDRQAREDIILEIKSTLSELSPEDSIEGHFGSPSELAQQYLIDEVIKPSTSKKAIGMGKKLFLAFGILVALLILFFFLASWYAKRDLFNYADMNSPELNTDGPYWHSVEWDSDINIKVTQAKVIFYWHDKKTIEWNCGDSTEIKIEIGVTPDFRHEHCLVFIPKTNSQISIEQSDVILIEPLAATKVNLKQSSLRIAEKNNQYNYTLNLSESTAVDLKSVEGATTITIDSVQARIKSYNIDK